ncbi:peptide ABC transporter permease [Spirochaetia bacterium]|nr:peptide ABC transporter permease [Spirochaetia bacterium]
MSAEDIPAEYFRLRDGDGPPETDAVEERGKPSLNFVQDSWRRLRKNRAAAAASVVLAFIIAAASLAPLLAPVPPNEQHIPYANLPPRLPGCTLRGLNGELQFRGQWVNRYEQAGVPAEVNFIFGTDEFGRDLFSRCLYGTRISLIIAFIAAIMDLSIGVAYGMTSAMGGGRTDTLMQRLLEILAGVPSLILVVLMLLIFRPGILSIIFALVISSWIPMARLVRAQTLRIRGLEYVLAARALGSSVPRIAFFHVLPNIAGTIIVRTMFSIPQAIFFETFLSFIGVGMKIPNASLGTLLGGGYKMFRIYPYQMWFPAAILCLVMLAFNLLADGLRDAFDPKMKD